jgi:hypothetical protein
MENVYRITNRFSFPKSVEIDGERERWKYVGWGGWGGAKMQKNDFAQY